MKKDPNGHVSIVRLLATTAVLAAIVAAAVAWIAPDAGAAPAAQMPDPPTHLPGS